MMDLLEIEIINQVAPDKESLVRDLCVQLKINHSLIASSFEYPIDIIQLIKTMENDGNFYLWTCHCCIAHCAGIATPVKIEHNEDSIKWKLFDLPFLNDTEFTFDIMEYRLAIENAWTTFKEAVENNRSEQIEFEIWPDPDFSGITKKLK